MKAFKNLFSKSKKPSRENASSNAKFNSIEKVIADLEPRFQASSSGYLFDSFKRELLRYYQENRRVFDLEHSEIGKLKRDYYYFARSRGYEYGNFINLIFQEPDQVDGLYLDLLNSLLCFQASDAKDFRLHDFEYLKDCPKRLVPDMLLSVAFGLKYAGELKNAIVLLMALNQWHSDVIKTDQITNIIHDLIDESADKQIVGDFVNDLHTLHQELPTIFDTSLEQGKKVEPDDLTINSVIDTLDGERQFYYGNLMQRYCSEVPTRGHSDVYRSIQYHEKLRDLHLSDDVNFAAAEKFLISANLHQESSNLEIRIDKRLKDQQVEKWFFEELWDYLLQHSYWSNAGLRTKMENCIHLHISQMQAGEKVWFEKLFSGFEQVPIPSNHDPYKGLHHSQIRPVFKLLQFVCEVDVTKFYSVDKESRVKFVLNGNQYQVISTDGFGYTIIGEINKVLLAEKVPYQLIALERKLMIHDPEAYSQINKLVISLISANEYKQFKDRILEQDLAGFAEADGFVEPFTTNIEGEKDKLKVKANLDQIAIEKDIRFNDFKPVIDKSESKELWKEYLVHCLSHPLEKKAGKQWMKTVDEFTSKLPQKEFAEGLGHFLNHCVKTDEWFLDDEKVACLTGMTSYLDRTTLEKML